MERRLAGGNSGGAVLVDGTVRRSAGPWTAAVHELLTYLEDCGFEGAPRALGYDVQGREVLSYLAGETVGDSCPWPRWTHSEPALVQAGSWLRRYHDLVSGFRPSPGSVWRLSHRAWESGDVIAHNDAAPYNAVWAAGDNGIGRLVGFIDWDFAAPQPRLWDLAYVAFSWVPLHARHVVIREGFTEFHTRAGRLRLLLEAYGWTGDVRDVLDAVAARISAHIHDIRILAQTDPLFAKLVGGGVVHDLSQALVELEIDRATLL